MGISYFAYQDQLKKQPQGEPTTAQSENIQEAPQDAAKKNRHLWTPGKYLNKNEQKNYLKNEGLLKMCVYYD